VGQRFFTGDCDLNRENDYFMEVLDNKTREGFEELVQRMANDGWTLVVQLPGFTVIRNLEDRVQHALRSGIVPFTRPKKK
jgi:hypothetical protein